MLIESGRATHGLSRIVNENIQAFVFMSYKIAKYFHTWNVPKVESVDLNRCPHSVKSSSFENLKAESTGKRVVAITVAPPRKSIREMRYPIFKREPVITATCPFTFAV